MFLRSVLYAISGATIAVLPTRATRLLPRQLLPVYGGSGGNAFSLYCGSGKVLTGLRFRTGGVVDAVGLLCTPVSTDGKLGQETTVGTLVGGGGGVSDVRHCVRGSVVVGAAIKHGMYVDRIALRCADWNWVGRRFTNPIETLSAAPQLVSTAPENIEQCGSAAQPAIGIRGRAYSLVDAVGFVCDEP